MKLVSLNIWGGKLSSRLLDFFKSQADKIDIFCLQEMFDNGKTTRTVYQTANMNIFSEIQAGLPSHNGYFAPSESNEEGLAIFSKKNIEIKDRGDVFCFRYKDAMKDGDSRTMGRNLQYISCINNRGTYLISNFHGLWNGINKLDSEDRLAQSEKISKFLRDRSEDYKILCGDFNLMPDTQSVKILEKSLRNLISEHGISSTRTSFYAKPEKFADYVFVSAKLHVKSFQVMPDEVSDHAALFLEFG